MTRVLLKGVHKVTVRLAGGKTKTYWYAWRGGPRLEGAPGSPEFIASYTNAGKAPQRGGDTVLDLLNKYQKSAEWLKLADKTRKDYVRHIKEIERKFGDFPASAFRDHRTRAEFLSWKDELLPRGDRIADYIFTVFARVLAWAKDRGETTINPLEKIGRAYAADRTDKVWSADDERRFLEVAPEQLHLPLIMALWTGQRQGDLLRLPWSAYDGATIRLRQSKTRARVVIPVGEPLRLRLDALRPTRKSPIILLSSEGRPWTSDGFRASWRRACAAVGVDGLTFHDLRGTAVTRLALAGSTEAEIATITGLSLVTVRQILDAHYLSRDPALAESAIRKLEQATNGKV